MITLPSVCFSGVFDISASAPRHHSYCGRIHICVSIQSARVVCGLGFVSVQHILN